MQRTDGVAAAAGGDLNANMTKGKKSDKMDSVMYVLFAALLVDLTAFTIILPLLPSILDAYGQQQVSSVS